MKSGDYINEKYFPKISKAKIEINNKLNGGNVMYTGVADLIYNDALEEGIEKGIEKGIVEGKIAYIISLVKRKLLDINVAIKDLGISEEEFKKMLDDAV